MNYANLNADNTLVGRFAGASALGVYSLAYNVMFTPLIRIANPISSVVYPALARMQDDLPRMRSAWLRSKRLSASLLAPAFLIALVTAPDLVRVLFGEKWHAAVPVIQLLAVAGVAHSLVTLNWTVLQGTGRMKVAFRLGLLVSALTVAAFAVGVRWGAVGVAAAYASIKLPVVLIDTYVTTRTVRFSFREALLAGGSILPHALLAAAGAWAMRIALTDLGAPPVVRLLVVVATACLLYAALLVVAAPGYVADAREVLGQGAFAGWHGRCPDRSSGTWHERVPGRLPGARGGTATDRRRCKASCCRSRSADPDSAGEAWRSLPDTLSLDDLEPGSFELMPLMHRNLAAVQPDDPELPRLKGIIRASWVKNNLLLGGRARSPRPFDCRDPDALPGGAGLRRRASTGISGSVRPRPSISSSRPPTRPRRQYGWSAKAGRPAPAAAPIQAGDFFFDRGGNICVLRSSVALDSLRRRRRAGRGGATGPPADDNVAGGTEVLVPGPTDTLLAACVAGARYGPLPPTQWLTDAVMILRAAELDWDRIIDLAVTHRQQLRLRHALDCLLDLPVPVPERVAAAHDWLAGRRPSRRDRLAFALSSGRLARRGGLPHALAELVAATAGESLVRTAARLPRHLCNRWSVEHRWQLPLAAGRRVFGAARRV